ncbi:MAG TPA: SDR family NAD(P)-dependent oxidoreductase, partial [Burkholderiaceae bacterium]|nr:SDR family NAD(P)-dependent oxidoreductase [Burkholderiaceae bacterium]
MFDDLRGKVVLITGAGTGIGAAAARAFGRAGAKVAVHYRGSAAAATQVVADIAAAGSEAIALQADLTQAPARERLVQETIGCFGRIDVLVNNAGDLVRRSPIAEADDALFDAVLDLNVRSVVALCRLTIPQFRR